MQNLRLLGQLVKNLRLNSTRYSTCSRALVGWPLISIPISLSLDGEQKRLKEKFKSFINKPSHTSVYSTIMADKTDDTPTSKDPNTSEIASNQPSDEPTNETKSKSTERMETLQEHLSQKTAEQCEVQSGRDTDETCAETSQGKAKVQKTEEESKILLPSDQPSKTTLFVNVVEHQWPIVYSNDYNIGFLGMEKLHPFDSGKWGKVFNFLKEDGMLIDATSVLPLEATEADLLVVHTSTYINSLRWSITVAGITEVPPVALLPNFVVQKKVLKPLRTQTGGTILAGKLAMERGWAINVGGGFHHCSHSRGGGFCAYADITLAIKFLLELGTIKKAMIVDLDAHQGNGHARDFMNMMDRVYIMDVYNRNIYPHDGFAKRGIRRKVELDFFTADEEYLEKVDNHLRQALEEFKPDIIVYNAGTDCLEGDPLGALSITAEGIKKRDQLVFEYAQNACDKPIPILMVTSGGYQRNNARIIADSILNLRQKGLVSCQAAEHYQAKLKSPAGSVSTASSPESTASTLDGATPSASSTSPTSGETRKGLFSWFKK